MRHVISITLLLTLCACSKTTPSAQRESESVEISPAPPRAEPIPAAGIHATDYQILGPFQHENLSVFLIRKEHAPEGDLNYLSLEEALKAGTLRISEKSGGAEVNKLEVENAGTRPVYLQAGDTVKGGQQDRTIAVDIILAPKSGKTNIDAFCVEPGRWSGRPGMADFPGVDISLAFGRSEAPVATKEQKLAVRLEKSQSRVWEAGGQVGRSFATADDVGVDIINRANSGSYVLAVEKPEVRKKVDEYERTLLSAVEGRQNLVGMAFAVNGEPSTVEIYAASGLFLKLWSKLLRSAAIEAFAKKALAESAKTAQASDIASLLDEAGKAEGRAETLPGNIRIKVYDGKTAALFDTEKDGELLHRQILKK